MINNLDTFKFITDNSSESIIIIDNTGKIIFSNKSFGQTFSKKGTATDNFYDLIFKADVENFKNEIENILNYGTKELSIKLKLSNGKYALFSIKPTFLNISRKANYVIYIRAINEENTLQKILEYKKLIDNSPDIIFIHQNFKIVFINQSGLKKLGFSKNQNLIGKSMFTFIHDDYKQVVEERAQKFIDSPEKQTETNIEKYVTQNGSEIFVEVKVTHIIYNNHPAIQIVARDITTRTKIELKLNETEYKFRNLVEQSTDGILILDSVGRIINWNKGLEILTNTTERQVFGKYLWDINYKQIFEYNEFSKRDFKALISETLLSSNPLIYNKKHSNTILINNIKRNIETVVFPILSKECTFTGFIIRDITEFNEIKQNLNKSEEFLTSLLEFSPDFLSTMKPNGDLIYISPSSTKVHGYETSFFGKINFFEIIHPDDLDAVEFQFKQMTLKSGAKSNFQYRYKHFNGSYRWMETTAINQIKNQIINGIIAVSRDINDRKEIEKKIIDSSLQYKNLIESSPIPVSVLADQKIIYVNPAAVKLLEGKSMNDFKGKMIYDFIVDSELNNSEIQNPEIRKELIFKTLNNNHIFIEAESSLIDFEGTEASQVVLYDVTSRKKMEIALADSEEKFRNLFEQSVEGLLLINNAGKIVKWNNALKNITGYSEKEVLNKFIWDIQFKINAEPTFSLAKIKQLAQSAISELDYIGFNTSRISKIKTKNNIIKTVESMMFPIETSNIRYIAASFKDITHIKNIEESLIESEEKFRNLVQQSGDGIIIVDNTGKIIEWNYAQEKITDLEKQLVIGRNIWDVQYESLPSEKRNEASRNKIYETVIETLRKGESQYFYKITETKIQKTGNLIKYLQVAIFPIHLKKGTLIGYITRDITKSKEYEEKLKNSMLIAEEANQAKSKFLANMSHEIRTPMNGILGFTEILLENETDLKKRENLSIIKTSGETLLKLINEILDLSKIEAGKLNILNTNFDIVELCNEVVLSFKPLAENKNLLLELNIRDNDIKKIHGDQLRIKQILVNLISNAIKFTNEGKISIQVNIDKINSGTIKFELNVIDTGIGIPKEMQEIIFDEFYQGNNHEKIKGTGLGLSIVKRLVSLMKGEISVNSAISKGSHFKVVIPMEISNSEIIVQQKKFSEQPNKAKKLRILVAEDDITNQHLIKAIAKNHGWDIDIVDNGKKAIEMFQKNNYSLILMDIQMPLMTGLEATKAIRLEEKNKKTHIPIIAFTAYAMVNDKDKCLEAGMDDYLSKPINFNELTRIISKFT